MIKINKFHGNFVEKLTNLKENYVYSPLSILSAFSMVLAGAQEQSFTNLAKALGYENIKEFSDLSPELLALHMSYSIENLSESRVNVSIANKIFIEKKLVLKDNYKLHIQKDFLATLGQCEFSNAIESSNTINSWVSKETNDKIKDLIPADSLSADTKLVLVNAVYFKGDWEKKFKPYLTKPQDFNLVNKSKIQVHMMFIEEEFLAMEDTQTLKAQIIQLPFQGNRFSTVLMLPTDKDPSSIYQLENRLRQDLNLAELVSHLNKRSVHLSVPKFKIESEIQLNQPMSDLGAGVLFTRQANLSGISAQHDNLFVAKAVHKAFFAIDEDGAEAAAATGICIEPMCLRFFPEPFLDIVIDRPFLAFVWDDHLKTALFASRVACPTSV